MDQQTPDTPAAVTADPRPARLAGVDVARALALFGMFTAHLGVGAIGVFGLFGDDAAEAFYQLTRGRSSALFAFLAGVALALTTGRSVPLTGTPLQRARVRILVRALVLALLGGVLDALDAPIAIILTYYGGFFLLALPLLRLRAPALMATAAAVGLLGPQVSFVIRSAMGESAPFRPTSIGGFGDFFLTGYYPALTFMAFVLAGLAVGRLDLRSGRVRARLAGAGALLAAAGYGGSWLLLNTFGVLDLLLLSQPQVVPAGTDPGALDPALRESLRQWMAEQVNDLHGQVPVDSPWWLAVASPHSGTTLEIAGATGCALLALVACLVLADATGWLLAPLAAAGSMSLTVYCGHIVVIAVLGMSFTDIAPFRLEAFVLGAVVFASLWRPVFGRGPLEWALGAVSGLAASAVPDLPEDGRDGPPRNLTHF
ncbi:heparan-alpha-glucosaminide N-acetyltransferase domain-containing protein [Nocardiopsis sediminis]|uniref:Heparan-alpha-glucosaminide N-acetyltransferase domain-containing protein n=1 Tax=Nocardiopsis sediminis TaxID=1778267 RepID=A0ABV8FK54_9ACTN